MTQPEGFPIKVSIITPAYNAAAVLSRAVHSLQAQTVADWEVIIVNDGSSDETASVARKLADGDSRLRVLHHETGKGAAQARNTALAAAKGRYIAFLDADDAWEPEKLSKQLKVMQAHEVGLSYTGFMRISEQGERQVHVPDHVTRSQLLFGNCICCSSVIYDRVVLGSVPMPQLSLRQDYALWLTMLERVPCAVGIDVPLVNLHMTRGSLSSNKWRAMQATWAMHHRHFGTGRVRSAIYVISHTLRRLLRG